MADKFQNKYRIPSARLQNWDYSENGAYFLTVCTKNREHYFGEIQGNLMVLNVAGIIAVETWKSIANNFPFVELGNFVIMPNHVHGVLVINKTYDIPPVETRLIASLHPIGGFSGNKNPMLNDNISKIIRWFKGRCSFEIRKSLSEFEWQARFHDHVIRDSKSFETIQHYIENNVINWKKDKLNSSQRSDSSHL